jgi:transposase
VHTETRVTDATSAHSVDGDVYVVNVAALSAEVASLREDNTSLRDKLARAETGLANLRVRYHQLLEELHLVKRRLTVAKAERLDDVADAQLAFDRLLVETQAIEKVLDDAAGGDASAEEKPQTEGEGPPKNKRRQTTTSPSGRRNLDESGLPEVPVEITDPELEGKAERIGVETSSRVGYERGGYRRVVLHRIIYKERTSNDLDVRRAPDGDDAAKGTCEASAGGGTAATSCEPGLRIVHAPMPREIMKRGMLAPSMIAYLLSMKYVLGVPFNRCEQKCAREGFPLDRGTMCRYAEHVGATLGCIVEAARTEAIATAFCLSTDATGVAIQPTRLEDGKRQPCRKGHFFVTLADKDHVFFDFQAKHTSLTVWNMFKGFSGYVQADAHAIYDALFKGVPPEGAEEEPGECGPPPTEVGCFSHARRKYWEAAVCRHPLGVEGVQRIDAIFAADRELADLPPIQRKARRDATVRPLVDTFFAWARAEYEKLPNRGLVATALGYSVRQERPLRGFLEDGRLRMENNAAERAIRPVALGRRAWLFYGSDDHAGAAGNILSLVASCKLHDLDPELYLAEVIRIVPYWPRDRYLELAPKYWRGTRARLSPDELQLPLGHITVPPPPSAKEQLASD